LGSLRLEVWTYAQGASQDAFIETAGSKAQAEQLAASCQAQEQESRPARQEDVEPQGLPASCGRGRRGRANQVDVEVTAMRGLQQRQSLEHWPRLRPPQLTLHPE
jgi:hypothetical protein